MDELLKGLPEGESLGFYPEDVDEDTLATAQKFEKAITEAVEEYESTAGDFETLLKEDHELLEELADEGSLLVLAELMKEEGTIDQEAVETAYLNVIDKCVQLSKTYHPLSEMGIDRLKSANLFSEHYERTYRPISTAGTASATG